MACQRCERPGYAKLCFDCRMDDKVARDATPDYRATLTEECFSCGMSAEYGDYDDYDQYEDERFERCQCPLCPCMDETEYGVTCNACRSGAHQG